MAVTTRPRRSSATTTTTLRSNEQEEQKKDRTADVAAAATATTTTTTIQRRSSRVVPMKPEAGTGAGAPDPKTKTTLPAASSKKGVSPPHKKAKSNNKSQRRRATAMSDRRKSKPLFLTTDDGDKVWIVTATLQDIRDKTRRSKTKRKSNDRLELVNVPSKTVRQAIYDQAARCWEKHEARILPTYGDRPWRVHIKITDPKVPTTAGAKASAVTPYFSWDDDNTGQLTIAGWPHMLDKIPTPPKFPGYSTATKTRKAKSSSSSSNKKKKQKKPSTKMSDVSPDAEGEVGSDAASDEDIAEEPSQDAGPIEEQAEEESDEEVESDDEEEVESDDDDDLLEADITPLSRLAYEERWRVPLPSVAIKWTSPLNKTFTTRASAWDNAVLLCKQEVAIDKALHGYSANGVALKPSRPSNKVALTAGRYRFERDGLWVVGQEEAWQASRVPENAEGGNNVNDDGHGSTSGSRQLSPLAYYLQCNRKEHQAKRRAQLKEEERQQPAFTVAAGTAAVPAGGAVGIDEETKTAEDASDEMLVPSSPTASPASFTLRDAERELRGMWQHLSDAEREEWSSKCKAQRGEGDAHAVSAQPQPLESSTLDVTVESPTNGSDDAVIVTRPETAPTTPTKSEVNHFRPAAVTPELPTGDHKCTTQLKSSIASVPSLPAFPESTRWKMTPEQCKLCYDAGMDHLDRIMRTVQARDLVRELQDGFDLLRERGRGRYDMELPDFDTPAFSFLSDLKKAPWMPIVREILGKDVVLIHKGMFLALPGAERQVYHQDGVHLTTQYQRDVHAINVFVPVVDMTAELGPTEFCLGSHLLGNEDFDDKFLESPIVKAGTPIIFDYRLGHRGLANNSDRSCRPIVYCTYARASDGKEFRDTVNFSRKRYHKIGDLVGKVATREERARKRDEHGHTSCGDVGPVAKRSCLGY